jgi:hypothetical protein
MHLAATWIDLAVYLLSPFLELSNLLLWLHVFVLVSRLGVATKASEPKSAQSWKSTTEKVVRGQGCTVNGNSLKCWWMRPKERRRMMDTSLDWTAKKMKKKNWKLKFCQTSSASAFVSKVSTQFHFWSLTKLVDLISIASQKEDQLTRHIARIPSLKYLNSSNIFVVLQMLSKAIACDWDLANERRVLLCELRNCLEGKNSKFLERSQQCPIHDSINQLRNRESCNWSIINLKPQKTCARQLRFRSGRQK